MSHSAGTLIAEIEAAFAGVTPGDMGIYEAEALDNYGTEGEMAAARRRDTFVDWRDIPDSALEACTCALSYLTPPSWQFCLPAYMRYSLRHPASPSSIADHTIYTLDLSDDESRNPHLRAIFAVLNRAQVSAVRNFLRFAEADDRHYDGAAAQSALNRYWETSDGHDTR